MKRTREQYDDDEDHPIFDGNQFPPPSPGRNDQCVRKRDGRIEPVQFDKITQRIRWLCQGLDPIVRATEIAHWVIMEMPDNRIITTRELDELAYKKASNLATRHPDYDTLAMRILVNNHHKNTKAHKRFSVCMELLYENNGLVNDRGERVHHIGDSIIKFIKAHANELDSMINHQRDYFVKYSGAKTLEAIYFLKLGDEPIERFQHMLMRVAVQVHCAGVRGYSSRATSAKIKESLALIKESYDLMSAGYFTHATPTVLNAGTPAPQMASCFLLSNEDSIEGMYEKALTDESQISKSAGGIGIDFSAIRSLGATIRSTNGKSTGLLRYIKVQNDFVKHINQSGRRNGAVAIYLAPWHPEIRDFLNAGKDTTIDDMRANNLFYALWIDDVFMERAMANEKYSLMDPDECPGLVEAYGDDFKQLYLKYEREGRQREQVLARDILNEIIDAQIETGRPYVCFKDHVNRKNNQANLGTIRCSNLCTEIVEFSSPDEYAVCNLASIALPKFVISQENGYTFDFEKLAEVTRVVVRNIDNIIDRSFYPVDRTVSSNKNNRPIGIGVQGLADLYNIMRFPYESDEAMRLNVQIFECMYFAAMEMSHELALERGPYNSFVGSPLSQGKFQFDLWDEDTTVVHPPVWKEYRRIPIEKWDELRAKIMQDGVRNSLCIALMPTASTSFILGNSECFEPRQANIFKRKTSAGEFITLNTYMINDLIKLGIWNEQLANRIMTDGGSIQDISGIPNDIKELYKTVWEIKQKNVVNQAAARGPFVDQTQSMNMHYENPTHAKITSALFYAWKMGLKTAVYYTRTRAVRTAQKFSIRTDVPSVEKETDVKDEAAKSKNIGRQVVCDGEMCVACTS